jgi:hypothetical protein
VNSNSTGVGRPKIETATLRRDRSSSTSSTRPLKLANGPSATLTCSPISKVTVGFGRSTPSLHLVEDAHGLLFRDRNRLVVRAEEARHLRRILDQQERRVGHLHLHEHVAREEFALRMDLATAAHLDDVLGRNQHLLEKVIKAGGLRPLLDGLRDLLLEVRVGVNDVPALCHPALL